MTNASTTGVSAISTFVTAGRLALLAGFVCLAVGCESEPEPVKAPPAPPTPEESFEQIVGALEEKLSDTSFGTADAITDYNAPPGTPITDATVRVKHQLTPPDGEGGVYRAQLCIITEATVTVTLPPPTEGDDEPGRKKSEDKTPDSDLDGMPSMDSLIVPRPGEVAGRLGGSGVHEIDPGVIQRCFDLEHRDGKWVLLSKLDRENEPFNALAIEYALKKQ